MFHNSGINKVILVGVIYNEPQWRIVQKEKYLCFQLVTHEPYNRQNVNQEHYEYHHIRFPENLVTQSLDSFKQGVEVYLEGKISTLSSVDQSGVRRYDTSVVVVRYQVMKAPVPITAIES